jgi:multicomponent Na+:H+ antiporter subunit C
VTLLFAIAVGVIFGSGTYLLLKADLFRIVLGIMLIANAANLALITSGLQRGRSPIEPGGEAVSDPLVQALAITAIVIGFAVAALLLSLAYRIYLSARTVDLDELSSAEAVRAQEEDRREEVSL